MERIGGPRYPSRDATLVPGLELVPLDLVYVHCTIYEGTRKSRGLRMYNERLDPTHMSVTTPLVKCIQTEQIDEHA